MPVPHVDDFRIQLAQADMNSIKSDLAKQLEAYSASAQRSLWLRLNDALELVAEALKNPKRCWVMSDN